MFKLSIRVKSKRGNDLCYPIPIKLFAAKEDADRSAEAFLDEFVVEKADHNPLKRWLEQGATASTEITECSKEEVMACANATRVYLNRI
jgi:hypothetical protein